MRWLERGAIVAVSLAVAIGIIALLSGGLAGSRDDPGIRTTPPPGAAYPDLGDGHLAAGALRPAYSSDPPTSGAHVPRLVTRERTTITDDQLLEAIASGDVVLLYPQASPPPELTAIAARLAPPFSPALARIGQAVVLARRPGLRAVVAVAWEHLLRAGSAAEITAFARYWLGRGAQQTGPASVAGTG